MSATNVHKCSPDWDCVDKIPINLCGNVSWHGVTCSSTSIVTAIKLSNLNITGTIPASIGALSHLVSIDLSYNKLSGSIPTSVSNIANLTSLNVAHNRLNIRLPSLICKLRYLKYLFISKNLGYSCYLSCLAKSNLISDVDSCDASSNSTKSALLTTTYIILIVVGGVLLIISIIIIVVCVKRVMHRYEVIPPMFRNLKKIPALNKSSVVQAISDVFINTDDSYYYHGIIADVSRQRTMLVQLFCFNSLYFILSCISMKKLPMFLFINLSLLRHSSVSEF